MVMSRLYIAQDSVYAVPVGDADACLAVERGSGRAAVVGTVESARHVANCSAREIFGVIGVLSLLSGPHLVVVSHAHRKGKLLGSEVYCVDQVDLVPLHASKLPQQQALEERKYVNMIKSVYNAHAYYFTTGSYNLTKSLAEQSAAFDDHFTWNANLIQGLGVPPTAPTVLPLIRGFVSINEIKLGAVRVEYTLVSRMSRYRAGTRFNVRGIDANGHVANFTETEQIVVANGTDAMSFLQTRGSIPLFWEQRPNIKYTPRIAPSDVDEPLRVDAFQRHIKEQSTRYGHVTAVNLVNNSGSEGALARAFEQTCAKFGTPQFQYLHFDFHHECRGMRFHRVSVLLDRVRSTIDNNGYTHMRVKDGSLVQRQSGVFRVNCIDCLDRTNVVESEFARDVLHRQLRTIGAFKEGDKLSAFPQFERTFKHVWADNADAVSLLYSGTGALKTDYTRTGKRSLRGMLQDGVHSVTRYYLNNFCDGRRQDAITLAVGDYPLDSEHSSAVFAQSRESSLLPLFMLIIGVGIAMIAANLWIAPALGTSTAIGYGFVLLWLGVTAMLVSNAFRNGHEYVDRPRFLLPAHVATRKHV